MVEQVRIFIHKIMTRYIFTQKQKVTYLMPTVFVSQEHKHP